MGTYLKDNELNHAQCKTHVGDKAIDLLRRLARINETVNYTGIDPEDLLPVKEIAGNDLGYCKLNEMPSFQATVSLPYLDADGQPLGGFGYTNCLVHIYDDGTAIAIDRCWKYSNMAIDGKPNDKDKPPYKNGVSPNYMTTKFYLLGCDHEFRSMTGEETRERNIFIGHCDHADICSKCGQEMVYNSSD